MKFAELREEFSIEFLAMCIIVGVSSALFTYAIDFASLICLKVYHTNSWTMYIYTPLVFMSIVFLLKKYFPYADGSGLPQGYAVDIFDKERLNNTYSLRSALGKALLTFMSIAGGASLGKEGPTIQICASLFAQIKNISDQKRRLLIKLGAGVGVATAFNTPIGGMVFAIEEYVKKINPKIATLLVGATLAAVFTSNLITGNKPYLGFINAIELNHSWYVAIIAVLIGLTCGISGALFTKLMVFMSVNKTWIINQFRSRHYILNALIFGLLIAFLGHLTNGLSFGNGSHSTAQFLANKENAPWFYALSKFFGAIASVSATVPGGYFSTALSIGAGIGDLLHHLIPDIPLVQFYLLGMAGFLAAITQSPITAVAMIVEMSDSSQFCLPILLSAFIASIISEQFGDSVYHQQVLNYITPDRYSETK